MPGHSARTSDAAQALNPATPSSRRALAEVRHVSGVAPTASGPAVAQVMRLQKLAGNRAVEHLTRDITPAVVIQRVDGEDVGAKAYGSFNTGSVTYKLVEGGCMIHASFSPGKDMPRGTRISFIQAIKTTSILDGETKSAANMPGQATDETHARIDQFLGNPSAYYLDYIDEKLLELITWSKLSPEKLGFDVRSFDEYELMAMQPITKEQFAMFWDKFDAGALADLTTVQTDTGQEGIKQQEGMKAEAAGGLLGFLWDMFASDTDAKFYDEPKHNIQKPTTDGEKASCVFHTAAVTKRTEGAAKVWDIIEWGYTVEQIDGKQVWDLIPVQHVTLDGSMMKGALLAMIQSTPGYSGPTSLVDPD